MTKQDKDDLKEVVEALSTAMVTMCRAIEAQWTSEHFMRNQVMAAFREEGQEKLPGLASSTMRKAIHDFIADRLEGKNPSLHI
jgi:hypothetical protein